MVSVARILALLIGLAAGVAAFPASAQNVNQIFLTESREFLQQHWKKLAAFDPAAFNDYAPEAVRTYVGVVGRGTDRRVGALGAASGVELKRRFDRDLALDKTAKDVPRFSPPRLANQTSTTARFCSQRTVPSQPAAEEFCWLIENRGGGTYAILEEQVPGRLWAKR